jgi:predicted NAD-dependent protein-ADP-ribosyltransferase YbiA (DUF1768 family)
MPLLNRTYRILDDGERIEGTWRHVFINNGGTYFLTDLKIYADGLVDCWELVDFDVFQEKVRRGWVATSLAKNGRASAHLLASWQFKDPRSIGPDELIAEVRDTIAELQEAPTSSQRLKGVLEAFVADPSEANRSLLRQAYVEIPEHLRRFVLGDQDMEDWPLKVLVGELGEPVMPRTPPFEEKPITEEDRQRALRYFAARDARIAAWREERNSGDPDGPSAQEVGPSVGEGGTAFAKGGGWADMSGDGYLSNDIPTTIVVSGIEYPSVTHAYWALSTDDPSAAEAIRLAPRASEAVELGEHASRKPDWPDVRLAIMTRLVRCKFEQHPDLAARLLATGNARISAGFALSGQYWRSGSSGRNWLGRILELVRSELRLAKTSQRET